MNLFNFFFPCNFSIIIIIQWYWVTEFHEYITGISSGPALFKPPYPILIKKSPNFLYQVLKALFSITWTNKNATLIVPIMSRTFAGDGLRYSGCSGGGSAVGRVRQARPTGDAVDEDMQHVWQILQPSRRGNCERAAGQPQRGRPLGHLRLQSLPLVRRQQGQERLKVVGFRMTKGLWWWWVVACL